MHFVDINLYDGEGNLLMTSRDVHVTGVGDILRKEGYLHKMFNSPDANMRLEVTFDKKYSLYQNQTPGQ